MLKIAVGLVALNRRLGCLNPNLPEDSFQLSMIRNANLMFESVNEAEFGLRLWRLFPTRSFRNLQKANLAFIE